jgi:hypothetical protein
LPGAGAQWRRATAATPTKGSGRAGSSGGGEGDGVLPANNGFAFTPTPREDLQPSASRIASKVRRAGGAGGVGGVGDGSGGGRMDGFGAAAENMAERREKRAPLMHSLISMSCILLTRKTLKIRVRCTLGTRWKGKGGTRRGGRTRDMSTTREVRYMCVPRHEWRTAGAGLAGLAAMTILHVTAAAVAGGCGGRRLQPTWTALPATGVVEGVGVMEVLGVFGATGVLGLVVRLSGLPQRQGR